MKTRSLFPCLGLAFLRSGALPAFIAVIGLIPVSLLRAQTFTTLYTFTRTVRGVNDGGINPRAGLIVSGSNLYGTSRSGGGFGNGTIFALNTNGSGPDGSGFAVVHSFCTFSCNVSEVGHPFAGLILSGNSFYGTGAGA